MPLLYKENHTLCVGFRKAKALHKKFPLYLIFLWINEVFSPYKSIFLQENDDGR